MGGLLHYDFYGGSFKYRGQVPTLPGARCGIYREVVRSGPKLTVCKASVSSPGGGICRRRGVGRREGGEGGQREGGGRRGVGQVACAALQRSRGMTTAGTGQPGL